jgi:hypothetical protein
MEDLGLQALHRRVAGIDVHRMLHVVTALIEQLDGAMQRTTREFGSFKRDCRALAEWLKDLKVESVVMESTGIYWKIGIEMLMLQLGDADCGGKGACGIEVRYLGRVAKHRWCRQRIGPGWSI